MGAYISAKIANASWGDKTVDELAAFIQKNHPELKGISRAGLYRMIQFYEIYASSAFVASAGRQLENHNKTVSAAGTQLEKSDIRNTVLVKLSWTHQRIIFSRCKTAEEREFYIKISVKETYSSRELERQIDSGIFKRVMICNQKLSPTLREIHPDIFKSFKDSYVFEFLNLPDPHSESDLQKGLIRQMKQFLLELGKDFLFIGEEYKVQVGNRDFYINLLFFHRGLQCLVAFELKKKNLNRNIWAK